MKYTLFIFSHLSWIQDYLCLSFGKLLTLPRCSLKFKRKLKGQIIRHFFLYIFFKHFKRYIHCECMFKNPVANINIQNISYFIQICKIFAYGNEIVIQYIFDSGLSRIQKCFYYSSLVMQEVFIKNRIQGYII